jgi:hypothetical protein
MGHDGFRDLVSDAHDWIQGSHGFLEDHGNARASELAHGVVIQRSEFTRDTIFCKSDLTGNMSLRRQESHDGKGG